MAFVIVQAVMKRLEERGMTRLLGELGTSMKLPRSAGHELSLEVLDLADIERPPMNRIPSTAASAACRRTRVADRPLRVLVAPDSFKGTFSSVVVAGPG